MTAIITSIIALVGTFIGVAWTSRTARRLRDIEAEREAERVTSRFRDPLLHAAYDLQSRLYNCVQKSFLQSYYAPGDKHMKEYALENTVFLFAQFFGWTELIRRDVRFLALKDVDETRKLREHQDSLYSLFQTDKHESLKTDYDRSAFRVLAGNQRAIGELMIDDDVEAPRVVGYAAFLNQRDHTLDKWLNTLRKDVITMATKGGPVPQRLILIQHALVALLEFLDPDYVYFPKAKRSTL